MDGRIDLDRARRDAKALLRAGGAPRLADAQRAVARELGATSWPALVRAVEARDVDELLAGGGELPARLRRAAGRRLVEAAREDRADTVSALLELGAPPGARDPATGPDAARPRPLHAQLAAV
jgi:hypothetical protein